jgi:hypothetical protein
MLNFLSEEAASKTVGAKQFFTTEILKQSFGLTLYSDNEMRCDFAEIFTLLGVPH